MSDKKATRGLFEALCLLGFGQLAGELNIAKWDPCMATAYGRVVRQALNLR